MELKEIVSISGKPGLYKVVAQVNKGILVESMDDKKTRFQVNTNHQVALLDEITIYTSTDENLLLKTVFDNMQEKQKAGEKVPGPKDDLVKIRDFFGQVAPNYDADRVYVSDMKKVMKWYEILNGNAPQDAQAE